MARRKFSFGAFGTDLANNLAQSLQSYAGLRMRQQIGTEDAMRNDTLLRQRMAEEKLANGEWTTDQASAYVRGGNPEPSVSQKLSDVMGDIGKATGPSSLMGKQELITKLQAKRVPLTAFGAAPQTEVESGDDSVLPSTPMGPIQSQPARSAFSAREQKLQSFPAEKIGEGTQGDGSDLQATNIFGKWNPDTGQMDTTGSVPAGMTAGQKGAFEGSVAAETERQRGPVQTANEVAKAKQMIPVNAQQTAANTIARVHAETKGAIDRAIQTGQLLPEQEAAAQKLADDYATQSKDYFTVESQFRKLPRLVAAANSAVANGQKPGAYDVGILFTLMKTIDPGAAVQEGDKANIKGAGSLFDQIQSRYNQALTGGFLTPGERQSYVEMTKNLYQSAKADQDQRVQFFSNAAAQRRIPQELVVRSPSQGFDLLGKRYNINGQIRTVIDVDANGDPILDDAPQRKTQPQSSSPIMQGGRTGYGVR